MRSPWRRRPVRPEANIANALLPPLLRRLRSRPPATEALLAGPIQGEPLGPDHLAERAMAVARGQRLAVTPRLLRDTPLLARLNQTRRVLEEAHAELADYAARDGDVGPAGEWLLDNYHVVREHIREVHESLPRGYYRELP